MKIYRIFGLNVASALQLPEANPVEPYSNAQPLAVDVRIVEGSTPAEYLQNQPDGWWAKVRGSTCVLCFRGYGTFVVDQGRSILVDKDPAVDLDDLRPFLFGSAFGVLLHQRGMVPLHVSAVAAPSGVVAFTGESGAGKSTLAAVLNKELNWPLVSDDVAVLQKTEGGFRLLSGVNTIKLWEDALWSLDRRAEGLRRDLSRYDKFHAIDADRFFKGERLFRRLVLLEWGSEPGLRRLTGREALRAALGAVYRPELAAMVSDRAEVAQAAMQMASEIEISVLVRPRDHAKQASLVELLKAEFAA